MNNNNNAIVLSYNESLLRESDIDLLKGPYWLNDTIISFFFEYLETDLFRNTTSLLFVSPEVTQCIKMSDKQEVGIFLDPLLSNEKKDFIFFALNDNEQIDTSGGSHWSLLVFSRPEKLMFHYDSSGSNKMQAYKLAQKVLEYFALLVQDRVESESCLHQNNGYDCGIHMLCNAQHLASHAAKYGKIKGCPGLHSISITPKRKEILDIIEKLKVQEYVNHLK